MPWQRLVADVAGELLPDGRPAYREVIVTVPRQSGKTTLQLAEVNDTAVERDGARMAFSMQTGFEAHKKMVNDWRPMMERSRLAPLVAQYRCSTANTSIEWHNGSRIEVVATSPSAGHGLTLDKVFLDEVWRYDSDSMEQSLVPTMTTRPHAQMWVVSTAGDAHSNWFRRKVEAGRVASTEDSGRGVAYFEWSAHDDADPYAPETWLSCMPALGYTITLETIEGIAASMSESGFRRAYLNQWVQGDAGVIPLALWEAVESHAAAPNAGSSTFAVDVAHDRSAWAIAVSDGRSVELVEYRRGLEGLVERCEEIHAKYGVRLLVDAGGPGSVLVDRTAAVQEVPASHVADAAMGLYDAVMERRVRVVPHTALTDAVEGAVRREQGDRWTWSRKGSMSDACPLVAASIAFAGASVPSVDVSGQVW